MHRIQLVFKTASEAITPNTATGDHGHALNRLRVVGVRAGLSLPLRELRSLQVRQTVPIPAGGVGLLKWGLKSEDESLGWSTSIPIRSLIRNHPPDTASWIFHIAMESWN
jgi:hypothetical protein